MSRAVKQLREQWMLTVEEWNDANRAAFEQHHLQPLTPQVTLLMTAVHRLAEVLEDAERECSDEDETPEL